MDHSIGKDNDFSKKITYKTTGEPVKRAIHPPESMDSQ